MLDVGDTYVLLPVDCDPDHSPDEGLDDALQEVAYWELQVSWVCPPAAMTGSDAERATMGAGGFTVTFVDAVALPPGPVQVML